MITRNGIIKFTVIFTIIAIVFAVAFSYIGIIITDKMVLAIIGFALLTSLLISMHQKGIFHQGHFPMTFGFVFIIIGGLMFWGTLDFEYFDDDGNLTQKGKLWDLTSQESGIFILLIVIGIWSFYDGARQALGASYFWGQRRR
jgi:hypothetical protein